MEWNDGWNMASQSSYDTAEKKNGSRSIKVLGDPESVNYASISIPMEVSSDTTFLVSAWGKANSVPETSRTNCGARYYGLKVEITYAGETGVEKHRLVFSPDVTGWQYGALNVVPKKSNRTITNLEIYCIYSLNANAAWFDNISVQEEPVQTYRYDDKGNLVAANQKNTNEQQFSYEGADLISSTSAGSGTYTYDYDSKHNLKKITNDTVSLKIGVDASGNTKSTQLVNNENTGGKKLSTSASFSSDGRYVVTSENSLGISTQTTTDAWGRVSQVQSGTLAPISYQFNNSNDRLTGMTQNGSGDISYTYGKGNLSAITRTDGDRTQSYHLAYDFFGNLLSIRSGNQTLQEQTYDAVTGKLQQTTWHNAEADHQVSYVYDLFDRLVEEKYNGVVKYRYEYNGEGDLVRKREVDASGNTVETVIFEYDSLGRLIRSRKLNASGTRTQQSEHIYDGENRLKSQTWQVGNQPARSESYTYHSTDGSLKRMVTGMGETIQYTYDALKRPSAQTGSKITRKFTYVDLSSTRTTAQIQDLTYDYGGTQNARSYHYTYDGNGNLSGIQVNGTETASYVYDSSGQLTEENLPEQGLRYEYTYDAFGNITQVEAWEEDESTPFLSRTYTYGNSQWLDQLTGWDNHTISYDEAGNPLNWYSGEKDWSLSWEGKTLVGASSASGDTITFSYDMDGQRSRKVVNGVTHQYLMQGTNVVYDACNGHCLEFIYDNVGQPYGFYYDGTPYYYVINQQGDVEKILNSQGSELVTYIYNAWGKPISIQDTSSNQIGSINPIRYRGYYYDSETGLYYLGARYYDPNIARFISADESSLLLAGSDSIGNKNLYLYTENNPVGQKDEEGHISVAFVGVFALVGAVADVASVFIDDCRANVGKDQKTWSSWQTYVGAAVGGAVGGALRSSLGAYGFDEDMAITMISSMTASLVTQTLEKLTIPEKRDRSMGSIIGSSFKTGITDTIRSGAIGACTGGILKGTKSINSQQSTMPGSVNRPSSTREQNLKRYGTRIRTWSTMGIRYIIRNNADRLCFLAARGLYNQVRK